MYQLINLDLLACATCTAGQVQLIPGDLTQGTETPTSPGPVTGADGCLTMVVTCPATNTGPIVMQFNMGSEGTLFDAVGAAIDATLSCVNGVWLFTMFGSTNPITSIDCIAA
uniref:C6 domain-containing protein n=1 Tax=Panagrolaimus sp. JU765 TaxID=591449 RepID=A0AC34PWV7_9BILA